MEKLFTALVILVFLSHCITVKPNPFLLVLLCEKTLLTVKENLTHMWNVGSNVLVCKKSPFSTISALWVTAIDSWVYRKLVIRWLSNK